MRACHAVAIVLLCAAGCETRPGPRIQAAVEEFRADRAGKGSSDLDAVRERVREEFGRWDAHTVMDVLETMYAEKDPRTRAAVMCALELVPPGDVGVAVEIHERKVSLARRGVADADARVALSALLTLRVVSNGTPDDIESVTQRIRVSESAFLLAACYGTLEHWGAQDTALDLLTEARPEDEARVRAWRTRIRAALRACLKPRWRGEGMPPRLGQRLLSLMAEDAALVPHVAQVLVALGPQDAPRTMHSVFSRMKAGAFKAALGAAVLVLDPQRRELAAEVVAMQDALNREFLAAPESPPLKVALVHYSRWLVQVADTQGNRTMLLHLWKGNTALPATIRAELLRETVWYVNPEMKLCLLSHIEASCLREMLRADPSLGPRLADELRSDPGLLMHYKEDPSSEEAAKRILELVAECGEPLSRRVREHP